MAAKHFIMYYQKGAGTYIITEPRPWARENKDLGRNHREYQAKCSRIFPRLRDAY